MSDSDEIPADDEPLVAAPGMRVPGTACTSMELGAGYGISLMSFPAPQQREVET